MVWTILDYGTPEEEAWRWKILPWYVQYNRRYDTYLYTVKYYDKPEGQDLLGKLIATNRLCLKYGVTLGVMDACMQTGRTLNHYQSKIGRFVHFLWPTIAVPTAFTTATYFAAKFRQKDDMYGHFFVKIFNISISEFSLTNVSVYFLGGIIALALLPLAVLLVDGKDVTLLAGLLLCFSVSFSYIL